MKILITKTKGLIAPDMAYEVHIQESPDGDIGCGFAPTANHGLLVAGAMCHERDLDIFTAEIEVR